MPIIVQANKTKEVHEVEKMITDDGQQRVWCETWPGDHTIGVDCEWIEVYPEHWKIICYMRDHADMNLKQIAAELKIRYNKLFKLAHRYNMPVKRIRAPWKGEDPYTGNKKFFNPDIRGNWMV